MHVSIRSLNKNFDKFHDYLETLSFIPCVICLSESRFKNQPQVNIEFDGYNFINISPKSNVGRAAMYIHRTIKYIRDKRFSLHDCECLWLNLFHPLT